MNCVWSLSFRDTLWGFLHLYVLLVTEETVVVDHLETVSALTILTNIWFYYPASLNKFIMDVMALIALEASFFHFRDDIRVSDDNALH
jgi:hypothetical protein